MNVSPAHEETFRIAAAIVKGADWNGWGPMEIANGSFASAPAMKAKAAAFAGSKSCRRAGSHL